MNNHSQIQIPHLLLFKSKKEYVSLQYYYEKSSRKNFSGEKRV